MRKAMIVYHKDSQILNKIDKSAVNIVYTSKKKDYSVIYFNAERYKYVRKFLSQTKGISSFVDSLVEMEQYHF